MSKVLIVTDEEIASYALAHQQQLLNALESVAAAHPGASFPELLAYARQELVIKQVENIDYDAITSPEVETPAIEGPVEEPIYEDQDEPVVVDYNPEDVATIEELSEAPDYEETTIEEPVEDAPVEEVPENEVYDRDESVYSAPEEADFETDPTDESLAFRRRRYQGLFHEASKLDSDK